MRRRRHRRSYTPPELNITAFLNLMVVLIPFLLLSAVFSHITILELNLPTGEETSTPDTPARLQLEVVIRKMGLELYDRNTGPIASWPGKVDSENVALLGTKLGEIKTRFAEITQAAVLAESDVDYQTLVRVMDAVRIGEEADGDRELFPDISIGDAPPPSEAQP